jgi:uncharacterized protein YggE
MTIRPATRRAAPAPVPARAILASAVLASAALAVALAAPPAQADPELRGTPAELSRYLKREPRQVVLQGHARQVVQSDIARVKIVVKTTGKDLPAALRANATRREAFVAALVAAGIDAKKVSAEKFSTSPQYGWFGKTPSSYEVSNRLTVSVADDRQLQAVSEAAAQSTETTFDGASFELSKEDEIQEGVRRQAFEDALSRRRFYEEKLGATLKPVAFQYYDGSARTVQKEEVLMMTARGGAAPMAMAVDAAPPVPTFDERIFEQTVDVTFEVVEPAAAPPAK